MTQFFYILLLRAPQLPCHLLGTVGLLQQVVWHWRVGEQDLYDPQPFANSFKLLMFFAASNGQVRTRTVRQSARGGGTPCPALIDYRWCGSARNCKAGYFKWWIFNYCIRHTTNCEWVENNNWECLTNGPTWHPIDSEKLRCHWSNYCSCSRWKTWLVDVSPWTKSWDHKHVKVIQGDGI